MSLSSGRPPGLRVPPYVQVPPKPFGGTQARRVCQTPSPYLVRNRSEIVLITASAPSAAAIIFMTAALSRV